MEIIIAHAVPQVALYAVAAVTGSTIKNFSIITNTFGISCLMLVAKLFLPILLSSSTDLIKVKIPAKLLTLDITAS
jgi:hypothetical protein